MDWELLRTFEVVARLGSQTLASGALHKSQSTISRHIRKLEEQAGSPLFLRETPIVLTQRGAQLLKAMRPMLDGALAAQSALENTLEPKGQVTLTTVRELVCWVLMKQITDFCERYPQLQLTILADTRVNSLATGEADLALRLVRPDRGDLVSKKIHSTEHGFFAASSLPLCQKVPWIGLAGSLAGIPEQRYAEEAFANRPPRMLIEDLEALSLAVQSGLGVAVLPSAFAQQLEGVVEVFPEQIGVTTTMPLPVRHFWMVVHQSKQHIPKVRAVIDWIEDCFSRRDLQ